jgi:hypothetical protein
MQNFDFNLSIVIVISSCLMVIGGLCDLYRTEKDAPGRKARIKLCVLSFIIAIVFLIRAFCFER